ncbi:excalibur calcium-binding domain-containing protein [Glycomyces sp. TRM65418]|uniref:excalibur calcium-binding domain-containing protein n=1 Tax=Glycomyces sp. TRM65418 TaxID=2867006 RepID=UPI001CE674E5|nr:excalibur calcium-binding domain-containing protein [Glycomyces sp. TRM65418]MCC3763987.1 excalibur calcium-binding domain-containing protein [Glycomyces sp. TRM65418]QZD53683.1 excalibur calcium-binding domain-containing protein [Glycomyces sp. TRM65418]
MPDDHLSAAGPQRTGIKPWSELSTREKASGIAILALPLFCCFGVVNMVGDDDDSRSPVDRVTEIATVATESPTEPEPTTTRAAPTEVATTEAATTEAAEPEPETQAAPEVYYDNCDAAREAGAAPVHDWEEGYGEHLDRDGDGVGCEDSSGGGDTGSDTGGGGGNDEEDEDVYYKNCDAARAAGGAPVYAGEPGYGSHLDRDGDGVGCE